MSSRWGYGYPLCNPNTLAIASKKIIHSCNSLEIWVFSKKMTTIAWFIKPKSKKFFDERRCRKARRLNVKGETFVRWRLREGQDGET